MNVVNDLLYDIPKLRRNESFSKISPGLGERTIFNAKKESPSPGQYNIKSNTELNFINKKGFTIRSKMKESV